MDSNKKIQKQNKKQKENVKLSIQDELEYVRGEFSRQDTIERVETNDSFFKFTQRRFFLPSISVPRNKSSPPLFISEYEDADDPKGKGKNNH
jgi:hypothetical protein